MPGEPPAVKGDPVAPVTYTYTSGASSDTDLHSAPNPSSGKWYGLSYLCLQTEKGTGGE